MQHLQGTPLNTLKAQLTYCFHSYLDFSTAAWRVEGPLLSTERNWSSAQTGGIPETRTCAWCVSKMQFGAKQSGCRIWILATSPVLDPPFPWTRPSQSPPNSLSSLLSNLPRLLHPSAPPLTNHSLIFNPPDGFFQVLFSIDLNLGNPSRRFLVFLPTLLLHFLLLTTLIYPICIYSTAIHGVKHVSTPRLILPFLSHSAVTANAAGFVMFFSKLFSWLVGCLKMVLGISLQNKTLACIAFIQSPWQNWKGLTWAWFGVS